ncbi:MAG: bifunctional metallophosphatase/5'-nucleotidase [Culicoidibacterales bacterium]
MQLSLFHTTDFHSRCTTKNLLTGENYASSLAHVATFFAQRQTTLDNSLIIDTGDFLQGSAITAYLQYTQPQMTHPVISFFNHNHYDAVIPGNHEFDYEPATLTSLLLPLQAPLLAANLQTPLPNVASHLIVEKQGIRFLIIGLTIPVNTQKYHFAETETILQELLQTIPETHYDCLICAFHGGFTYDPLTKQQLFPVDSLNIGNQLLENFPMIDILLTGHQHQTLFGHACHSFYSQAGSYAQSLNELTLTLDYNALTQRWSLGDVTCHTHDLATYLPDPEFVTTTATIFEKTKIWLQEPLAKIATPLINFQPDACFQSPHRLIDLLQDFQQTWGRTQISTVSIPKSFALTDSQFCRHQLFQAFAYDDLLVTVSLKGSELLTALQRLGDFFYYNQLTQQIERTDEPNYFYDLWSGITYTIHVPAHNEKNWVTIEKVGHEAFSPTAQYEVTMNCFRACGGGGYPNFQEYITRQSSVPIQMLFADFLQQLSPNYEIQTQTALTVC